MRRSSFALFLRQVTSPAAGVRAAAPPLDPNCAHLFQRGWCIHCKGRSPFARVRGAGAPRVRRCRPESDEQREIIQLLVWAGCRYGTKLDQDTDIFVLGTKRPRHLKASDHATRQTPGIPDLWAFLPEPRVPVADLPAPRAVWIEGKAEDGRPSPAQERFRAKCEARGIAHVLGTASVVRAFLVRHGFLRAH